MTRKKSNRTTDEIKALMAEDGEFLRAMVRTVIQEFLEAEMSETIGAQKGERTEGRLGYRSGYYPRSLSPGGKTALKIPQDRQGRFSTEIFERYQRSEKALVAALTEMYIQGVSTRKVKTISEELCGHSFSASAISGFNKKLDEELGRFARRELECEYPYLILDARYEKVRENAVIRSRAVLVAIGIDWEGRRQVLGVEMANRESSTSWKEFLVGLKRRGLRGVIFAVSDDHPGLKRAIMEVVPEAYWQRCYVHFLRNALDYLPRKVADVCLVGIELAFDPPTPRKLGGDLAGWLLCRKQKYPRLCAWVEENIEETFTFYR